LASAISSGTELNGAEGLATSSSGRVAASVIGAKSLIGSYFASLLVMRLTLCDSEANSSV
jgi:hypothetical protein